jgi:hypothetical protein
LRAVSVLAELLRPLCVCVASSGRSIDIFPAGVSKRTALQLWQVNNGSRWTNRVLCVGDRGDRFGNDYEFLANSGGFSVDKIDWSPYGCFPVYSWSPNISTGPALTSHLLRRLTVGSNRGLFIGPSLRNI